MVAPNPKKEFLVTFPIAQVKEAIHKTIANDPKYYILVKDDPILNQIRIHQKGNLMDMGYHIDFDLRKVSDNETNVLIEVSRNAGAINTATEVSIANNSLKSIIDIFSAFLAGNLDEKGKPKLPAPAGCMLLIIGMAMSLALLFACNKDTGNTATGASSGCGTHNGKTLHRGSSGGCYYINSNGNKTYVNSSECRCP